MKRHSLVLVTMFTLALTALVLSQVGWFRQSARSASPRQAPPHPQARAHDPFLSDAALRYRRNQPRHWRACLLQN